MAGYRVSASDPGSLMTATTAALEEWNAELDDELRRALAKGGKVAAQRLGTTAPKESGKYRRNFRHVEETTEIGHHESRVTNKRQQLTHLLVDGFDSYNQYGGPYRHVGPASPEGFLEDAFNAGLQEIERELGV